MESLLFIADGITDLDEEVMKIEPGSDFQLDTIHYARGLKSKVKEKDVEIIDDTNKMFKCNNKEEAISKFNEFENKCGRRCIKILLLSLKDKEFIEIHKYYRENE